MDNIKVCIYADYASERLCYVLGFIFKEVLCRPFEITSDVSYYETHEGAKLNYSNKQLIVNELQIIPDGLLFEKGVNVSLNSNIQNYFNNIQYNTDAIKNCDIFSVVFFIVCRYEEYQITARDAHHRFESDRSYQKSADQLKRPICDEQIWLLAKVIHQHYPIWSVPTPVYRFQPTLDLDNTYAYLGKGMARNVLGLLRDIATGQISAAKRRVTTLLGLAPDPNDTYKWQAEIHEKHQCKPIYFFLLGKYAPYDKMLSPTSPIQQKLLRQLAKKYKTGLHPSYLSNTQFEQLNAEAAHYQDITGQKPTHSRQHFLKLQLPNTYRNLISIGIKNDYSMGYADQIGFRAGTSYSHFWFDLEAEKITTLRIHPLIVMDVTLQTYQKLTPDQALAAALEIHDQVRKTGGTFCTLWHNDSLIESGNWIGWRRVYAALVATAAK